MKRTDFQKVVEVVAKEHDSLYEFIRDTMFAMDEAYLRKQESVLRTFLLEARAKGFNVDAAMYPLDKKIAGLSK